MADTKRSREAQARNAEQNQRARELEEALDRREESLPPFGPDGELGHLDAALDRHEYPATTADIIATFGDWEVQTKRGTTTLRSLLTRFDGERFESPDAVRSRLLGLVNRG